MSTNIQEVLNSAQASAFAQLATQPNTVQNFSQGLKDSIEKVGLASLVAASLFIANMGNAEASSTNNALKIAAGISALVGVVNHNDYAMNLPDVCNVRGVNGWKIGGATFGGAALMSAFGKGNGKKLLMALGGFGANQVALEMEEQRVLKEMQHCAAILDQMEANKRNLALENKLTPNFLVTAEDPRAIVFYTFPDKNGRQTFVTWETSKAVASMQGKGKGKDINSNKSDFAKFDKALDDLKFSYNDFNKISQQWIKLSQNQQNIEYAKTLDATRQEKQELAKVDKQNKEVMQQAVQAYQQAYQSYILTRGNFMAHADAAVLDGYSLKTHKDTLELLQIPQAAKQACNCNLKESHNVLNQNTEIVERLKRKF